MVILSIFCIIILMLEDGFSVKALASDLGSSQVSAGELRLEVEFAGDGTGVAA